MKRGFLFYSVLNLNTFSKRAVFAWKSSIVVEPSLGLLEPKKPEVMVSSPFSFLCGSVPSLIVLESLIFPGSSVLSL